MLLRRLVPLAALVVVACYGLALSRLLAAWDETPERGKLLAGFLLKLAWWVACAVLGWLVYALELLRLEHQGSPLEQGGGQR